MPKALRPAFEGRSEIKRSLHTRDIRIALVQARRLSVSAYELFALVKATMVRPFDPNDPSTWPTASDVVGKFEYVVEEDLATGKRITRIKTDPSSAASVAAGKDAALALEQRLANEMRLAAAKNVVAAADAEMTAEDAAIAAATRIPGEPAMKRGRAIDAAKLTTKERARLLSVLWPKYAIEQAGAIWTKSRTVTSYNQMFETFLNWIGDRPIYMVTREDYANFKSWMLTEYVSPTAKPGEKGLDARSVDKYTTAINGLFKWAQNSGFFPEDKTRPTALQTIMSKTAVRKRAKQRIANRNFHDDELKIAFDPQAYAQENQVPHHFWGPLLALFTGARRAEVAQLLLRDVRQEATDTGSIWVIDISDDDVQKNVKSDAARRTVPVHPVLIDIGLLDYINEVKAEKLGPQLFPHVEANKHGEKGNAIGNAWRRYLIARGLRSKEQKDDDPDTLTFHSLRHTSIALLKKKKVSYDMRCQMVGHEAGGQQDVYGGDTPVETLAEVVFPVFKYPGLDFAALKYRKGSALVRKKAKAPITPDEKPKTVASTKRKQ